MNAKIDGGAGSAEVTFPRWTALRRRPRVLLAWEHGRNFGRLSRLLRVSSMIEQQGGEPIWAVPRRHRDTPQLVALSHRRLVAPAIEQQVFAPDFRADSFADVLLSVGFDDPRPLTHAVQGWLQILEQLQPECVLLDYAPTAQLATQLLGVRAFQLTNGFDAPPSHCPPYADVRADSLLAQRNAQRVQRVSENIAQVAQSLGGRPTSSLQAILDHPRKIFECIPEADPYGTRTNALWVGPLGAHLDAVDVPWPEGWLCRRRVFAQMRTMAGATELLDELLLTDAVTLCVWRDAPPEVMARYRNTSVRVLRHPVRLERVLPEADAVVNQGSTALVCQTLLAGKPQLIVPSDFEKLTVARRVAQSGAASLWNPTKAGAREAVRCLLHTPAHAEAARTIAERYPPHWLEANRNRFARALIGEADIAHALRA
jgi:hypothetical protein